MSKYKKVEITPRKLDEIKQDVAAQTMLLMTAYLMDEWDYNEDKIVDVWSGVSRYAEAVNTKLITLDKVAQIIEEHTGLKVRWHR